MSKNKIISIFLSFVFLFSCSKEVEKVSIINETNQKVEMISAYQRYGFDGSGRLLCC